MHVRARTLHLAAVAIAIAGGLIVASCGGGSNVTMPLASPTPSNAIPTSFATVGGAPTVLSGTNQTVSLPAVPGVPSVGGTMVVTSTQSVTTVVTIASVGASGGPPALQSSSRKDAQAINGVPTTPQYYVGVTNTTGTPTQVNFSSLTLGVNVPSGSSVGLAHYDPAQPQNGWNQHCATGSQVNTNGNNTTFTPNANLTIYPGATLWFAPYTYPSSAGTATPPPSGTGIIPTPAPAPASLTGTYVGSAMQSGQAVQYLEFSLTQSGSSLSGTYAVLPASASQQGSFGSLSGSVSGGVVTLSANAQYGGACVTTLNGTASGMLIAGTFASQSPCSGSGTFSAVVQTASLPAISGTYTGPIADTQNGAGTLTVSISQPGTVWSGLGTVTFPSNPNAGGTSAIVGFVTNSTTAEFAVIGGNGGGGGNNNNSQSCNPFGTIAINGGTLTGTYTNSGGSGNTGCTATGKFTISH